MNLSKKQYHEIWIDGNDDSHLCALINGNMGYLMYLPDEDGRSFSSRNPDYKGDNNKLLDFSLENGQLDYYPLSWCLPLSTIEKALIYFKESKKCPSFIKWHDDGIQD